uniref:Uncharacterized protein n=1 Tax=Arundo donax TaxID=35708 RepID=A0A0A9GHS6_ARUDO
MLDFCCSTKQCIWTKLSEKQHLIRRVKFHFNFHQYFLRCSASVLSAGHHL